MNPLNKLLSYLFPQKPKKEPIPVSSPQKALKTPSTAISVQKKQGYSETFKPTPNVSPKPIKPRFVILHHTGGNYEGSVSWCLNPASRVSYHCIIAEDGRRTVLAPPDKRTWHAGVANWNGTKDINSVSVGVAFEKDTYLKPLTFNQLFSLLEYLKPILTKYQIKLENVLDHRMIAPNRKNDLKLSEYDKVKKFLKLHL